MEKAIVYFDTSALINLKKINHPTSEQITNKYDVILSLLNFFEIIVYENSLDRAILLDFFDEIKKHLPLDLPTSIVEKFLSDYTMGKNQTCWSARGERYPDWNDSHNIVLIKDYLKKEKEHFKINNIKARAFISKNNMKTDNPQLQNAISFLSYIYNQNSILLGIFEGILYIQPKLNFQTQEKIDLMKSLPLICYFVPWFLGHHSLAIKNSHFSPKKNPNSIDVAHSFYMGACDIFITDDERLHTLLDNFCKFKYFNSLKKVQIMNSNQFANSL
jgi:hypothetical protein